MSTGNLDGRRALIVGGSGGIGSAVAGSLHEAGVQMTLHGGHNCEKLQRLANRFGETSGRIPGTLCARLTSLTDLDAFRPFTDVHILIVAFGPIAWTPLCSDSARTAWDDMVTMNLALPGVLAEWCLPYMVSEGFGRIVFFGATAGDERRPSTEAPAYTAAKAGLSSLARSIARSHASSGVNCNVVCPGYVDTEYLDDEQRQRYRRRSPTGRLTDRTEVARIAHVLCTTPAVNGATINASDGIL